MTKAAALALHEEILAHGIPRFGPSDELWNDLDVGGLPWVYRTVSWAPNRRALVTAFGLAAGRARGEALPGDLLPDLDRFGPLARREVAGLEAGTAVLRHAAGLSKPNPTKAWTRAGTVRNRALLTRVQAAAGRRCEDPAVGVA